MKNVKKTVVKESVGRDLVGASAFANRSTVIDMIVKKYPTPQALSDALKQLAANTEDERVQKKILEIAAKAETLSPMDYPAFVKKIAGFNKLWGIAGKTVGAAAVLAGVAWVASAFYKAGMEQLERNKAEAEGIDVINDVNKKNEEFFDKHPTVKKITQKVNDKTGIAAKPHGLPIQQPAKDEKYFGKVAIKPTEKNPVHIAHEKLSNVAKLKNVAGDAKESMAKDVSKAADTVKKAAKKLDVKPSDAAKKAKKVAKDVKQIGSTKVKEILDWYKKQRG